MKFYQSLKIENEPKIRYSVALIVDKLRIQPYQGSRAVASAGPGGQVPTQFLTDQLILSQPKRGQIVLTRLLIAPMHFQTFLQPCLMTRLRPVHRARDIHNKFVCFKGQAVNFWQITKSKNIKGGDPYKMFDINIAQSW